MFLSVGEHERSSVSAKKWKNWTIAPCVSDSAASMKDNTNEVMRTTCSIHRGASMCTETEGDDIK
jgi:hypothetical protein